jgi:hypothetical protein
MRTASGFNTHNAICRQGLGRNQKSLIFFGIDIIGDHRQLILITHTLAQDFYKRRLARTNWATNTYT